MAIVINGSGTVTGISVGGLPDDIVDAGTLAANSGTLTEVDQWRLTTDYTGNAEPIASNLERVDSDGFGRIGTGMTESSGLFTFPSTGIWRIDYTVSTLHDADNRYTWFAITSTLNDTDYDTAASAYASINVESSNWYGNGTIAFIFDVTSVSTHKVRFHTTHSDTGTTVRGSSGSNETHMTFMRLGDT